MVAEPFTAPEQSGGTIVLAEAVSGASGPEMVMVTVVGLMLFVYSTLRFRSFLGRQG